MPKATEEKVRLASKESRRSLTAFLITLLVSFILSTAFTKFNPFSAMASQGEFWRFIFTDFIPPKMGKWRLLWDASLQTALMAIASSGVSAIFSLFLALIGSSEICHNKVLNALSRAFASALRNIPGLVWAFILVAAFGIGTEVGVLSLILGTTGQLTRYFIETIEEVASDVMEPLKSIGSPLASIVSQAILPEAMPGFVSWFLYTVELNVRASAILGMVGAGGIGMLLTGYIKQYNYGSASTVILAVALIIIAVNLLTDAVRKAVLK